MISNRRTSEEIKQRFEPTKSAITKKKIKLFYRENYYSSEKMFLSICGET